MSSGRSNPMTSHAHVSTPPTPPQPAECISLTAGKGQGGTVEEGVHGAAVNAGPTPQHELHDRQRLIGGVRM
ncbi:unnamed protein product [Boreogadus saida]